MSTVKKITPEEMKAALERKAARKIAKAEQNKNSVIFSDGNALLFSALDVMSDTNVDTHIISEGNTDDVIAQLEELVAFLKLYKHTCYFDVIMGSSEDL